MADLDKFAGKMKWNDRYEKMVDEWPSLKHLAAKESTDAWVGVFNKDMNVWASIMRDVLKRDQSELSDRTGAGRLAPLDYEDGLKALRRLVGNDYSMAPFAETFKVISEGKSISSIRTKTGLSRTQIFRLLNGHIRPDIPTMEAVAKGFKKSPSFFLEYRVAFVLTAMAERLESLPESTVDYFQSLKKA